MNELEDESLLFQMGFSQDYSFNEYDHEFPQPSSWNKFPTVENPSRKYKFTSLEVNLSLHKKVVNRQSYSLLDWLGDFGGLIDGLYYFCKFLISPVVAFSLQATLLSTLFRVRPTSALKSNAFKLNSSFF